MVPRRKALKAYMFINAGHGQALAVAEAVRGMVGVLDADAITGDFDVVATLESKELGGLRSVMTEIQKIDGINKTTTCLVLKDFA